jgi:ribonuclease BN (tRNA processing enzyme)
LGKRLTFEDFYDVHIAEMVTAEPRKTFRTSFRGIELELFHTNHIPGEAESPNDAFITYGLFVDGRVFLSGDTKFDIGLIDTYKDKSEVMFHDASVKKNAVHASVSELRTLDQSIREKMYLMHYQDDATEADAEGFAGLARRRRRYLFD